MIKHISLVDLIEIPNAITDSLIEALPLTLTFFDQIFLQFLVKGSQYQLFKNF